MEGRITNKKAEQYYTQPALYTAEVNNDAHGWLHAN